MLINKLGIDFFMKYHLKVTTILLISLILVFMSFGFVIAVNHPNNLNNDYNLANHFDDNAKIKPNCTNLYWLDNTHKKQCGQKRFCDVYMYEGLKTFEKLSDCKAALLNLTNSTDKKENYGQCVLKYSKEQNICFKQAEAQYKECNFKIKNNSRPYNMTLNKTQIKEFKKQLELASKECLKARKNSTDTCKINFKESKNLCEPLRCNKNQIFFNNKCIRIDRYCNLSNSSESVNNTNCLNKKIS